MLSHRWQITLAFGGKEPRCLPILTYQNEKPLKTKFPLLSSEKGDTIGMNKRVNENRYNTVTEEKERMNCQLPEDGSPGDQVVCGRPQVPGDRGQDSRRMRQERGLQAARLREPVEGEGCEKTLSSNV